MHLEPPSELDCQTESQPIIYLDKMFMTGIKIALSGAEAAAASAAGHQSTTHIQSYLLYIVARFSASLNKHYI